MPALLIRERHRLTGPASTRLLLALGAKPFDHRLQLRVGGVAADVLAARMDVPDDAAPFERASGRRLADSERAAFIVVQHRNYRRLFLRAGLTHGMFLDTVAALAPEARQRVASLAETYV